MKRDGMKIVSTDVIRNTMVAGIPPGVNISAVRCGVKRPSVGRIIRKPWSFAEASTFLAKRPVITLTVVGKRGGQDERGTPPFPAVRKRCGGRPPVAYT